MKAICLPRRNRSSFWAFCSSRLTFFLKWEFWMILFKTEAFSQLTSQNLEKIFPAIDREDFNSSTESTISTSLIHSIASEGKSKQIVTWLLNLIFQHENVECVGNLPIWSSDICCLSCPTIEFCGGNNELTVDGLPANIGIGVVLPILSSSLTTSVPVPPCTETAPVALRAAEWRIPWQGVCDDSNIERELSKTFSYGPDRFHVSSGTRLSQA